MTSATKDDGGGSAFPSHGSMGEVVQEGMSLRDWFAGQALPQAIEYVDQIARGAGVAGDDARLLIAAMCYEIADAMIAERSK